MDFTVIREHSFLAHDGTCVPATPTNPKESIRHCRIQCSDCPLRDFLAAGPHYEPF